MSDALESGISSENGVYFIKGKIDEHFNPSLLDTATEDPIIIDLSLLKSINSVGIKNWIIMLENLGEKKVLLRNTPFFFVDQLLMIQELKGHSTIESLELPFFCDNCDKEQLMVFQAEEISKNGFPTNLKCPNDDCDEALDFDEDEDSIIDILKED